MRITSPDGWPRTSTCEIRGVVLFREVRQHQARSREQVDGRQQGRGLIVAQVLSVGATDAPFERRRMRSLPAKHAHIVVAPPPPAGHRSLPSTARMWAVMVPTSESNTQALSAGGKNELASARARRAALG